LNLNKVYVLTTKATASASELVINCLKSYIDVVQIGDITTGKNVGSITYKPSKDERHGEYVFFGWAAD
jgi:C-terminal processing protease CtpA/Prc